MIDETVAEIEGMQTHSSSVVAVKAARALSVRWSSWAGLPEQARHSLAEQIQRAFPAARVVKSLNTMNANVMVNPQLVAGGEHTVFVSGDDAAAKAQVVTILRDWFGWRDIVDLGGLKTARTVEMFVPLWVAMMLQTGSPLFQIKVVQ